MKKLILLCFILFYSSFCLLAQDSPTYTFDGVSYDLKTEIAGTLSLYYIVVDGNYQYFIGKGEAIVPLINTKNGDTYQEEYKKVLRDLSQQEGLSVKNVKLTRASLRRFVKDYHLYSGEAYTAQLVKNAVEYRVGLQVGFTNNIFTASQNPNNEFTPQFTTEFELYDPINLKLHAVLFQYKQTFSTSALDFSFSQFSINYRFKFWNTSRFSFYVNNKLATFTISQSPEREIIEDDESITTLGGTNFSFQGSFIFGLGADIKLGPGWLTLNYNDAFTPVIDDNGEFPLDITAGYRIKL